MDRNRRLWSGFSIFRHTIRDLGWMDGCLYAFARLAASVSAEKVRFHKYYLIAQPIVNKRWLPPNRGRAIEVRQITTQSDPIVKQFPRPEWVSSYRFKQGAVCLAALKGEAVVGFLWLALGPYQEDEVRCRYVPLPEEKAAWDFDVYVEPEYRNGIVFLKLWDEANHFLIARRVRWSLSRISAFNRQSILAHARMGAWRIGAISFLSLGTWQIAASTVSPYFHISTRKRSFPTFLLQAHEPTKIDCTG